MTERHDDKRSAEVLHDRAMSLPSLYDLHDVVKLPHDSGTHIENLEKAYADARAIIIGLLDISAPSAVGAHEPVAWRWRVINPVNKDWEGWCYGAEKPTNLAPYIAWEWQPLFPAPSSAMKDKTQDEQYVLDRFNRAELADLDAAIMSLSMAMGNPAMHATVGKTSIEAELIRHAALRISDSRKEHG